MEQFDVFVIGSGIAGQTVAEKCVNGNLKVAIADKREFGGTCANRGCDPKKVMLGFIEVLQRAKNLEGKGITDLPKLKWQNIQKFKKNFTDNVPASTEKKLRELNIKLYHQSPKFIDESTLLVEGKTISFKKAVIATGYEPTRLSFKGAEYTMTSDNFLDLKKLPKSMVFIGAGYVGMEFANIASAMGVLVTVIDKSDRPLKAFDKDLVNDLVISCESRGINFIFNANIESIEKLKKNLRITYTKNGKERRLKSRTVFNTAGRVPAIAELDLENANVDFNENGVITNEYLQSKSNRSIYSCGDVSDKGLPLTPLSGLQGYIVGDNIISDNSKSIKLPVVPSVVFTHPNIASVGLSEEEAKRRYKNVVVEHKNLKDWFNATHINSPKYACKIISNKRTDKILGAHILSETAAEIINIFVMAINQKMTVYDIKQTIFTYPSWGYDTKSMV
ncbi:Glutathione-disulfide reductase [Flagellimonas maritima]|uniref:Dihydrolipoyl dehydrogenase n=1 Tax=Flagellimonas maritima TaxID=1383885 RepID=A0A2Z4LT67_9FLAO|nr:NAD(P)/FAD-dependent oxidoreductase [Allomuricauda aurantiaca]AWX44880.1 Glutathione-disulfide reductase [Allomuricauda aurantiaca]